MEKELTAEELRYIDGQTLLNLYEKAAVVTVTSYKKLLWDELCRRLNE